MRRLVFYGCFFLLVWNVSLIYAQDKEIVRQALACKDYDRVIEETNRADTLDAECREWRLQAFRALGRWTDVRNLLEEALAADTTQAGVYADLADCYRQQGNVRKASRLYAHAVRMAPEVNYLRRRYVQSLLSLEDYAQVRKACHDWLSHDSLSAEAYRFLGQSFEAVDSLVPAFLGYRAAYRLDSLDAQTVARVANIFNSSEQYEDALEVTEKYRLTDTTSLDVNRQNAKAYCLLERYPEAIRRYEALKQAGDRSFLTYYYLGVSYYGDNWFYGAYDNLKEALKKAPPSPANIHTLVYFARAASRTSWKDEGVKAMEKAMEYLLPADSLKGVMYGTLAECYELNRDSEGQIRALKKRYECMPNRVLLYRIGMCYYWRKDWDNAIQYLRRYMAEVPEKEREARDEKGNLKKDTKTYYQNAEDYIKKIEEERFFEGKK
mgnify:FL=1